MTKKRIATLIEQEVQKPTEGVDNSSAITTTQTTQMAELKLAGKSLFEESKELWNEFVAFDEEHKLTQRVGAQLWRLTQVVAKPVLLLSIKGIQVAVITIANPENRDALAARFTRSKTAQDAEAILEPVEK